MALWWQYGNHHQLQLRIIRYWSLEAASREPSNSSEIFEIYFKNWNMCRKKQKLGLIRPLNAPENEQNTAISYYRRR